MYIVFSYNCSQINCKYYFHYAHIVNCYKTAVHYNYNCYNHMYVLN